MILTEKQDNGVYHKCLNSHIFGIDEEHTLPVLFSHYYPTCKVKYLNSELQDYYYVKDLKKSEICQEKIDRFLDDLTAVFSDNLERIVLTAIPSSKKDTKNVVTQLVEKLCLKNSDKFVNGVSLFTKIRDEKPAHENNNESRSIEGHCVTWEKDPNNIKDIKDLKKLPVFVIDDVLTTGATFDAAYLHLRELGIARENIIFYAFAKTIPNILLRETTPPRKLYNAKVNKIGGVIFDMDQTVFDTAFSRKFDNRYSQIAKRRGEKLLYDGIVSLFNKISRTVPIVFVSNEAQNIATLLLQHTVDNLFDISMDDKQNACDNKTTLIYTTDYGKLSIGHFSENESYYNLTSSPLIISYNDAPEYNKTNVRLRKPRPEMIFQAIELINKSRPIQSNEQIVGVGNTNTDLKAYSSAGVIPAYATWGNRVKAESDIENVVQFDSVADIEKWLCENI
ncbi:hypothetical protein [Lactiplantibacillus plantarum]|uniref:hypothetical protein n=1 Tax=Lactiplantibacillus plantarum TaxID=1590 RepID=UPI001B68C71C|nr:hypothetical protein [Lactiplantibacillus plantarum]MBP5841470.1 hypothetical protein [Lactiplantibacillus plantarum]MDN3985805.1 hypothetical protein [Lactiplantibacillus plantarum]